MFDPNNAIQIEGDEPIKKKSRKVTFDPSNAVSVEDEDDGGSIQAESNQSQNNGERGNLLSQVYQQSIVQPSQVIAKGYDNTTADVYGNLNMLAELIGKATNTKPISAFKNMEESTRSLAKSIPDPQMNPVAKGAYNMIGSAIPASAEAEMIAATGLGGALEGSSQMIFGNIPAAKMLSSSAINGIQSAINSYRENPDLEGAIVSGERGAMLGLGINASAKAAEVGLRYGKAAAKAFVHAISDNEQLAEHFVNNLGKYTLRPWGKVPKLFDVEKENKETMDIMKQTTDRLLFDKAQEHQRLSSEKAIKLDDEMFNLRQSNKSAAEAAYEKSGENLKSLVDKAETSFQSYETSLGDSLHTDYSNALEQLETLKTSNGEAVETATANILKKDPFTTVNGANFFDKLLEVGKDNGYVFVEGKFVPNVSSVPDEGAGRLLNDILKESSGRISEGRLTLGYVQELKSRLGQFGYGNDLPVAKQLSGALNPVKLGINGKMIGPEVKALAEANSKNTMFENHYKEALAQFTRPDASGGYVPDTQRALSAIRGNDRSALALIKRADEALPEHSKLFPRIQETATKVKEADAVRLSTVEHLKNRIKKEKANLETFIKTSEHKIGIANRKEKSEYARHLAKEYNEKRLSMETDIKDAEIKMKDHENFLSGQALLRRWIGPGRAGRLQTVGGLGLISQTRFPNPVSAAASTALSLFPSPLIAASGIKLGASTVAPALRLINTLAKSPGVTRTLAPTLAHKQR